MRLVCKFTATCLCILDEQSVYPGGGVRNDSSALKEPQVASVFRDHQHSIGVVLCVCVGGGGARMGGGAFSVLIPYI